MTKVWGGEEEEGAVCILAAAHWVWQASRHSSRIAPEQRATEQTASLSADRPQKPILGPSRTTRERETRRKTKGLGGAVVKQLSH